jgi:glutathione synthase/RimK-type ligase-like ATP-grasp enzyme
VSPKLDVRVTVVGSSVFAYEIRANGHAAAGDWRLHRRDELSYHVCDLPAPVRQRCVDLCAALKIPFGAIDLLVREDEFVFVEVNPTGEWAWLPDAAETAGCAIAEWLAVER